MFAHRCSLLLQKSAMEIGSKLTSGEEGKKVNPLEAWNNTQVFFMTDLAKAYGEYYVVQ